MMNRKELLRSLKFLLFSLSAGIIELGAFSLLNELTGWSYWPCYLIALTLSVVWNFTLNRRYTFQSASNVPRAMALVLAFYCVFTPASTWLGHYLADVLGWNEYLVTALNMIANFVLEFLYDRFVVFRDSLDTNSVARRAEKRGPSAGTDDPPAVFREDKRRGKAGDRLRRPVKNGDPPAGLALLRLVWYNGP